MSYSQYFKTPQKKAYSYIGGNNTTDQPDLSDSKKYISNQVNLLEHQNQKTLGIVPSYINRTTHDNLISNLRYGVTIPESKSNISPDDGFDPYYDFLNKRGVLKSNGKPRIISFPYTINSNCRRIQPIVSVVDERTLDVNPLSFDVVNVDVGVNSSVQNLMVINAPGHNVQLDNKIILSGVPSTTISLKTIFTDINGTQRNAVTFTNGSASVVFYCNFDTIITGSNNVDKSMSFIPNFSVGTGISFSDLQSYDTSDMFVSISGFDISTEGTAYVGNIPINFLNSTHQIYFTNPNSTLVNGISQFSPDTLINVPDQNTGMVSAITGFYILLPFQFIGTNPSNSMKIDLTFNFIGGIPINKINAQFPVNENNIQGYHTVHSTTPDTINILLDKATHYQSLSSSGINAQNQISFGGNNIYLATINTLDNGFSSPNNYRAELPNVIHDVVMVRMLGCNFPNTGQVFNSNSTIGTINTKLYWQNQDDGNVIYSIEIDPGNYTPEDLAKAIENKISLVPRQYSNITGSTTSYTNQNSITVSIDTNTNVVTFSSFKQATLRKPIQDISPEPPSVGDGNPPYKLTISQDAHGLLPGDTVVFSGFIATSGIPTTSLNGVQTVVDVPTPNTYTVSLDNFNLLAGTRSDTGGGFAAQANVPTPFRLLFNYSDTMGNELGFRKVGQDVATYDFNTVISNTNAYQNETVVTDTDGNQFVYDESGNKVPLTNNSIKVSGTDYVLMVIRGFNNFTNISNNKIVPTYFAKINLDQLPGTMIYNSFNCPPLIFYEPIDISNLDISFYTPNGQLYDFKGIEHSFDIEFTSVYYEPETTGIVTTRSAF